MLIMIDHKEGILARNFDYVNCLQIITHMKDERP